MKRMFKKRWVTDILVVALVVMAIGYWQTRHHIPSATPMAPLIAELPEGSFSDLVGNAIEPVDNEKNATLLYFFAPWCQVCRWTINDLEYDESSYWSRNVQVIAIALDYGDVAAVEAFIEQNDVRLPVVLGNSNVSTLFKVNSFPTYYFLNSRQEVVDSTAGYTPSWSTKWRLWRIITFG